MAARADKRVTRYAYGPQTDVYSFGLILWELVTNQPLFEGIKGKDEITTFVCSGQRPALVPGWPRSLQTMLSLCWEKNPSRRPAFQTIQRDFQQVLVDLMCPDPTARKIARSLWLGQETRQVPYVDFERVFTQKAHIDLATASLCYRRCLCAMLCDPFENVVNFERFCTLVHYFGPVSPADRFLNAIVTLFEQPWFFGSVRVSVAKQMLLEQWHQTKQAYYMFRFSDGSPGSFSLFTIDGNGQTSHRRIGHLYKTEYFVTIDEREHAFKDLHSLHAYCVQVPSVLRGKHVLPGAPYQCFFAATPLRASVDESAFTAAAAAPTTAPATPTAAAAAAVDPPK